MVQTPRMDKAFVDSGCIFCENALLRMKPLLNKKIHLPAGRCTFSLSIMFFIYYDFIKLMKHYEFSFDP
jgi:hypothetical protein